MIQIDVLVANAGRGTYGAFHQAPTGDVRDMLSLNVASTVNLVRSLVPRMLFRRYLLQQRDTAAGDTGARILLISSIAGVNPGGDIALYSAAKAFMTNFAMVRIPLMIAILFLPLIELSNAMLVDSARTPSGGNHGHCSTTRTTKRDKLLGTDRQSESCAISISYSLLVRCHVLFGMVSCGM